VPFRPVSLILVRRFVVENRFPSSVSFWPHIQRSRFDHTPIWHMNDKHMVFTPVQARSEASGVFAEGHARKAGEGSYSTKRSGCATHADPCAPSHHALVVSSSAPSRSARCGRGQRQASADAREHFGRWWRELNATRCVASGSKLFALYQSGSLLLAPSHNDELSRGFC
jgi:hypothetical protein